VLGYSVLFEGYPHFPFDPNHHSSRVYTHSTYQKKAAKALLLVGKFRLFEAQYSAERRLFSLGSRINHPLGIKFGTKLKFTQKMPMKAHLRDVILSHQQIIPLFSSEPYLNLNVITKLFWFQPI